MGTGEDTESRRKQENFADMKQAVREVLQELGIGSQETQNRRGYRRGYPEREEAGRHPSVIERA